MREDVVGVIPAAGTASRLGPLPCSKEIYPIGFRRDPEAGLVPKVAVHYVLERMRTAGIKTVFLILKPGKWDIPAYLEDGGIAGVHVAYLTPGSPFGAPYTLERAYPFIRGREVALGFADIVFDAEDAYGRVLERRDRTGADVVLGIFPTERPEKADVVELDGSGRITRIAIKPARTDRTDTWAVAVWGPAFTDFMHRFLERRGAPDAAGPELHVGHVIQAAIDGGMRVEGERLSDRPCVDFGTAEDMVRVLRDGMAGLEAG